MHGHDGHFDHLGYLDLCYSHIFMVTFSAIDVDNIISKSSLVSDKSYVRAFSSRKTYGSEFKLSIKRSKVNFHSCRSIRKQIDHVIKMVKVNPVSSFEQILVVLEYSMLYTNFQDTRPLGSK